MKTFIGIDPGEHCGYAMWCPGNQTLILKTLTFWELIERLDQAATLIGDNLTVVIEDPTQNKPVFFRGLTLRKNQRVAQNVGMNKGDAKRIIEWLQRRKVRHIAQRPSASSLTKMTKDKFYQMTGYCKSSSEHSRDAACLVWAMR